MITYRLSLSEMHLASVIGLQRALDAIRNDRQGRYGADNDAGFDLHIIGCAGELALAKHLNVFWNGAFGDLSAADVWKHYQVRATTRFETGRLLLHREDKDDQPFVLVRARLPLVVLVGWIFGRDGKQQQYWNEQTGRPCFFIPAHALHDMHELPR